MPVKLAYFIFGAALTAICATGIYIWLGKRERRGMPSPRLRTFWNTTVIGVPGVLAATFVARVALGNEAPFAAVFWGGLVLLLALAAAAVFIKPPSAIREKSPVPG